MIQKIKFLFFYKNIEYKQHRITFCHSKKFQGFGFLISNDNPQTYGNYLLISFKFLFFDFWYVYEYAETYKRTKKFRT